MIDIELFNIENKINEIREEISNIDDYIEDYRHAAMEVEGQGNVDVNNAMLEKARIMNNDLDTILEVIKDFKLKQNEFEEIVERNMRTVELD